MAVGTRAAHLSMSETVAREKNKILLAILNDDEEYIIGDVFPLTHSSVIAGSTTVEVTLRLVINIT